VKRRTIVVVIYCHLSKHSVGQTPRLCNLPSKSYSDNINVPYTGGNDLVKESGKPFNGMSKKFYIKQILIIPLPFSLSLCFLTLLDCPAVRELIRGGVGPHTWEAGVSPWSDVP
jgi:hypothetical protein